MLSPHTPPGTKVVCIDPISVLELHAIYTVIEIFRGFDDYGRKGMGVRLEEIPEDRLGEGGWGLHRFKPAVLPKCLTDCLTSTKTPELVA
jgi:hypothetical protein